MWAMQPEYQWTPQIVAFAHSAQPQTKNISFPPFQADFWPSRCSREIVLGDFAASFIPVHLPEEEPDTPRLSEN